MNLLQAWCFFKVGQCVDNICNGAVEIARIAGQEKKRQRQENENARQAWIEQSDRKIHYNFGSLGPPIGKEAIARQAAHEAWQRRNNITPCK